MGQATHNSVRKGCGWMPLNGGADAWNPGVGVCEAPGVSLSGETGPRQRSAARHGLRGQSSQVCVSAAL